MLEGMKDLPFDRCTQARCYVIGRLRDVAVAPQIIVERLADLGLVHAEQDVNAWRLDVGVDYTDAPPLGRQQRGDVGGDIGFARPAPKEWMEMILDIGCSPI